MLDKTVLMSGNQNQPEPSPKNGKIRVKLITPLFESYIVEADSVLLPALDGDILILPNRAPIFLSLKAGRMIVYNKGEEPIHFLVSSGVCEVRRNLCPVMAWGGRLDKINPERIEQQLKVALRSLPTTHSLAKSEALSRIEFLEMVLKELNYHSTETQTLSKKTKDGLKMTPEDFGIND